MIVEFTTREPIPQPQGATAFSYWLYLDMDRPYWAGENDEDLRWEINLLDGEQRAWGGRVLPREGENRIALLTDDIGNLSGRSASIIAEAHQSDDGAFVQSNTADAMRLDFPQSFTATDLSRADGRFTRRQKEVFHYRGVPDMEKIECRVIEVLGDRFDVIVSHSEMRFDSQTAPSMANFYRNGAEGAGLSSRRLPPCGDRLIVQFPFNWIPGIDTGDREHFNGKLWIFAHEFAHSWTSHLSYEKDGEREPLFGEYCHCHWRGDLHLLAAFPWAGGDAESTMGVGFWRENRNGTFTAFDPRYQEGGFSWLDLYAMGLADAREVPDMLLLRNLQAVSGGGGVNIFGGYAPGEYTADKEFVSIRQVVAVEGPRTPDVTRSRKDFNAGFVYMTAPGQAPSADLLEWHARFADKVPEYWFHITGGRSRITTRIAP